MPAFTITEPHPTVKQNSYTHAGRGGAGNLFRAPLTTAPAGVPTEVKPYKGGSGSSARFYSGRGGAGNAHAASAARPVISFEDEYARADAREKSPVVHVGRGGAGNIFGGADAAAKKDQPRKHRFSSGSARSDASSRRDSSSTTGSLRAGFWGRLSGVGSSH